MFEKKRGRPKTQPQFSRKTSVLLTFQNLEFLDHVSARIIGKNGVILDRGSLIRAMLSALEKSNLDLVDATTEEEAEQLILERLQPVNAGSLIKRDNPANVIPKGK